jgi:Tol biopolymer transport system component
MKNNMLPTSMIVFMLFAYMSAYMNKKAASEAVLPTLSGEYMGQEVPGTQPQIFARDFVSTHSFEYGVTFSPDGQEFYFSRQSDINVFDSKIYGTRLENGEWTKPEPVSFSDRSAQFEAQISPDGQTMYFISSQVKPNKFSRKGDVWTAKKSENGWEKPKYAKKILNDYYARHVTSTTEGTLYFTGYHDHKYGIYRVESGCDAGLVPEYLPLEINYLKGVAHPYIAPDESYLLFDAQTEGLGKTAIYISFRNEDGTWTEAQKLDSGINASHTEKYPSMSPDGRYLFFVRHGDIYWVDAGTLKELKSHAI